MKKVTHPLRSAHAVWAGSWWAFRWRYVRSTRRRSVGMSRGSIRHVSVRTMTAGPGPMSTPPPGPWAAAAHTHATKHSPEGAWWNRG